MIILVRVLKLSLLSCKIFIPFYSPPKIELIKKDFNKTLPINEFNSIDNAYPNCGRKLEFDPHNIYYWK